ncbi:MAG: NADH-quinone oxidoreductase subunit C [Anaerolineales bacterium]
MTETLLAQGLQLVEGKFVSQTAPEPNRIDLIIEPAQLTACAGALAAARWGYLSAITGLDHGPESGKLEALYHFCNKAAVITLRVSLPREKPSVPSVCGLIPSATLFERELMEMFGIVCEGTPDTRRLFLPDEWPDGVYPLRKDFIVPAPSAAPEE